MGEDFRLGREVRGQEVFRNGRVVNEEVVEVDEEVQVDLCHAWQEISAPGAWRKTG